MIIPSGYGLRFYGEYTAFDFSSVPLLGAGRQYTVYLYQRGYTGDASVLGVQVNIPEIGFMGAEPVVIGADGNELWGQKPLEIPIRLVSSDQQQLSDFAAQDDREIFVCVATTPLPDQAPTEFWAVGYTTPFEAKEPLATPPYLMEVTATCGLGLLGDYPFLNYPNRVPLVGPKTLISVLQTCLSWLGYDLPVWVSMLKSEEKQWEKTKDGKYVHPGVLGCPFTTTTVLADLWQNDKGEWASCKQVIDDILTTFNLRLKQDEGVWKLLCLDELPQCANRRIWHKFATLSATSYTLDAELPGVVVGRESNAIQLNGSFKAIQTATTAWKANYDYGDFPTTIVNGNMLGTTGTVPFGWLKGTGMAADNGLLVGDGTPDHPFSARIKGVSGPDPKAAAGTGNNLYQKIDLVYEPKSHLKLTFSGVYVNHHTAGIKCLIVCKPYIGDLPVDDYMYWMQADGTWANLQKKAPVYLVDTNYQTDLGAGAYFVDTPTSGKSFSFSSDALPNGTPRSTATVVPPTRMVIWVYLLPGPDYKTLDKSDQYTDYRAVQLKLSEQVNLSLEKEVITAQVKQIDTRRLKTEEITLKLGDQTTAAKGKALRRGALRRLDGITPTTRWMTYGGDHLPDEPQHTRMVNTIQALTAYSRLFLTKTQPTVFDGALQGEPNALSVLRFTSLTKDGSAVYVFPLSHKLTTRARQVELRALAIPPIDRNMSDTLIKGQYVTPEGGSYDMTMPEPDADTTPVHLLPGGKLGGLPISGGVLPLPGLIGIIGRRIGILSPVTPKGVFTTKPLDVAPGEPGSVVVVVNNVRKELGSYSTANRAIGRFIP